MAPVAVMAATAPVRMTRRTVGDAMDIECLSYRHGCWHICLMLVLARSALQKNRNEVLYGAKLLRSEDPAFNGKATCGNNRSLIDQSAPN